MITRTYISKFSTIINNSELNIGINPVGEMVYGDDFTRMLVYFDHSKLKEMVDKKVFCDESKLKHYLKITNAGSLDFTQLHCGDYSSIGSEAKVRASSFTLLFFLIPQEWDGGKGFDYAETYYNRNFHGTKCNGNPQNIEKLSSKDGVNWFQARNGYYWDEEGIYTNETLTREYNKFSCTEGSDIIIARQKFDIGNESICVDITDTVNKFISGELKNYGLGIAFEPNLEVEKDSVEHYAGFLTHKTNTFFEPFLETIYDEQIKDDRANFALDKNNKLYLYCNVGDELVNLDEIPTCDVNGTEYEVKQATKGVYYIDITLSSKEYKPNTMLYDTWSNIKYEGVELSDVELDFTTKSGKIHFNIGDSITENIHFTPSIYGIQYDERIKRGDVRKIVFNNKVDYQKNQQSLIDDMEWRLYVKDGTREVDVFPYEKVNMSNLQNFAVIDTSILIPQTYYVDVKYKYNMEMIMKHNVLSFVITDDLNNKYN